MAHTLNLILNSLPAAEQDALKAHLQLVNIPQHHILYDIRTAVDYSYFPVDAVISLVVPLSTGEIIEAAMVGRDGVVGGAAALDGRISVNRAVTQIAGHCLKIEAEHLRSLAGDRTQLLRTIIAHEQVLFAQAQQSAACNITHPIESRLARWLLRASDLCGSHQLDLTQEYLAEMLGVRRTSVSLIASTFQEAGFIRYRRGHIHLVNLQALHDTACECYESVKLNYDSFLQRRSN
jgi:CRP-like cAMP-binding protein